MATSKKTNNKNTPYTTKRKTSSKVTSALKASNDKTSRDTDANEDLSSLEDNSSAGLNQPSQPKRQDSISKSPEELPSALKELFLDEIKDIYWAEKQLTKVLPKMQQAASSSDLADAIGDHLEETRTHVDRLEQIFDMLGEKPQAKKCDAMEGITKEGERIVEDTEEGTSTRDAGVIMASQKVEHYEMATYGSLKQIATVLQLPEVADLLSQTLEEERAADEKLSQIAEGLSFAEKE